MHENSPGEYQYKNVEEYLPSVKKKDFLSILPGWWAEAHFRLKIKLYLTFILSNC